LSSRAETQPFSLRRCEAPHTRKRHGFGLLILCAFMLFLFTALLPGSSMAVTVEGRIFNESGPMKGAKVYVYRSLEEFYAGEAFLKSGDTDEEGFYKIDAPEGGYYFVARGREKDRDYFAYHGNNPIVVGAEGLWMILLANEVKPPVYSDGEASLEGIVTLRGRPVADAYVSLYKPETKRLRGLGIKTESVKPDGSFSLTPPNGKYIVVAKKTEGGKKIRPLKKGDLFCYYPQNPVEVKSGQKVRVEVPCYPKSERDLFVEWRPIKPKDFPTVEQISDRPKYGIYGISGRVRDVEGKPVAGVYVLAYPSEGPVLMLYNVAHGTEYVSQTDSEGKYFIPINADGDYFVIARSALGGSPQNQDIYGIYGDKANNSIHFTKGNVVERIDITAGKAMSENALYALKSVSEVADTEYKTDFSIDRDTLWKGVITINGTVSVKKGATLTIEPGAVIKFKRLDRDNNGIGDGELMVEGRIIARGTSEKRILFTSAEKNPEVRDWSYVMVHATGTDNVFEYCEFRYAYSGIQLLYSNGRVADCLFDKNYMGLRINRANIVLEHNTFRDNAIGFKFARLEGNVVVRDNVLTANDVGVLYQQPQQKTVDWEQDAVPPADSRLPLIAGNNIYDNREYNMKLGERKAIDLNFPNNWWGSTTNEKIEELIFDSKQDDTLGKVTFVPFLLKPVEGAGVRTTTPASR